jgi:hypothetical protein
MSGNGATTLGSVRCFWGPVVNRAQSVPSPNRCHADNRALSCENAVRILPRPVHPFFQFRALIETK